MQTNTYTILNEKREDMEKKLRRLAKKAQKYGIPFDFSYGEPYAIEIEHKNDDRTTTVYKYEVFDLTIESETIKKDGYTVLARLEHSPTGNIVNVFDSEMQKEWVNLAPFCDHCNSNHGLKVTFMVSNGEEVKQVGRTCLKDYCGIDPQMIGMMNAFYDDIEEYTPEGYDFREPLLNVFDSVDILAHAIKITKEQGYIKSDERNSNKGELLKYCRDCVSSEYYEEAETMAKGIMEMPLDDAINAYLNNVQVRLNCLYCKPTDFGYFAYAPTAYAKYLEKKEAQKRREAEKNAMSMASDYVGTVGERSVFDVKEFKLLTCFDNDYGTTFLYRFIDYNDNVLIWFASSPINDDTVTKIKATVKAHSERDGIKQTVLTRVKVA